MQTNLAVISAPKAAAAALKPIRLAILQRLREPDSAAAIAAAMDAPRQRIGYHVKQLEREGFLKRVGERRRGNMIEQLYQTTARHYIIGPGALGDLSIRPDQVRDHFSSDYLVAVAAQTVRDVGELRDRADEAGKKLPTFTLQTEIAFSSAEAQGRFAEELGNSVIELVKKFHDAAPGSRSFRLIVGSHPTAPRNISPNAAS